MVDTLTKDEYDHLDQIVQFQVNKYWHINKTRIPYDDLLFHAHRGLTYALKYFEEGKGRKLTSFATMIIVQKLVQFITRKRHIFDNMETYIAEYDESDSSDNLGLMIVAQRNTIMTMMHSGTINTKKNREYFYWLLDKCAHDERHKAIVRYRAQGMVYEEIGKLYRLSHQRIRQIINVTLDKMKMEHIREEARIAG
jgi:DNA-directed RNA polymerase sigma subunit (sigma70/sigma32)